MVASAGLTGDPMSKKKSTWIEIADRQPESGQFVRVEVREQVGNHSLHFEGQARFDDESGWQSADGEPYLTEGQEIRRWKPLLDGSGHEEWEDFLGDLTKD